MAGFKLNVSKTKLLAKNIANQEREDLERTFGLNICEKAKYLGIWITSKNINLYQDNYVPAWAEIKRNLDIWSKLKLSFSGRVSMIKMSVPPKLVSFSSDPVSGNGNNIFQNLSGRGKDPE